MPVFVPYNPKKIVPTTAASDFARELKAAGHDVFNFGIGQESERAPVELFPDNIPMIHGPDYQKTAGLPSLKKNAADFMHAFLGIEATADTTFVLQQQGRFALQRSLICLKKFREKSGGVILPDPHWPTYDELIADVSCWNYGSYDVSNESTVEEILDMAPMARELSLAIVINTPQNPTGKIYSDDWMKYFADRMEESNQMRPAENRIAVIFDIPYFYALPKAGQGDYLLDGGFGYLARADAATPWTAVVSFSKALGLATPGFSFAAVHPSYASAFGKSLISGIGGSYNPGFFAQAEKAFAPENYPIHRAHYAGLREKYELNYAALRAAFGNLVVDGGPGMTALVEFEGLVDKQVEVSKCAYELRDGADIVEYIGNKTGVVVVDQGEVNGKSQIRVAAAERPERYAEGIARLARVIAQIQAAPSIGG